MTEIEKYIGEHYLSMTQKEMGRNLGISASSVEYYIRKNKWFTKKNLFSDEAVQYMIDNYQKMEYKDIAKYLNFTERQVRGKLNNLGYTKLRKFNKHYFHEIDSEIKAYFIGFLFADGWVINNSKNRNYEVGMQLQSCDRYILERLNNELGGVHIITHEEPTVRIIEERTANIGHQDVLRIYSKEMVTDLIRIGITTRKTEKDIYPKIPKQFFFDFLRGYIDGDGCYWKTRNNYFLHITCASKTVLEYIQERLLSYGIPTTIYMEKKRKYRLVCSRISTMKKLIPMIYHDNNVFCLSRKKEKVQSYLGSAV